MLSNAVNIEIDKNENNLIDFNNSDDPLIATIFDSDKENYNLMADKEFNGFVNEFQDEFIKNDMNEFERYRCV